MNQKTGRKLFVFLFSLALILGLALGLSMTAYAEAHTHDNGGCTFTPWDSDNSLPDTAGDYYLTTNVTLDATWTVPTGTTKLCLDGHTIDAKGGNFSVITIGSGVTLELYDKEDNSGLITGSKKSGRAGGVYVRYGGFTMYGGTISGNTAKEGGGIAIEQSTNVEMRGGTISNNTATNNGGGAYVLSGSKLTMYAGAITNNQAKDYGGGVDVNGSSFVMEGGTISNNNSNYGGGVYATLSSYYQSTMKAGTITDNTATYHGGGVYTTGSGTFNMEGGTISTNSASLGGGVYVDYQNSPTFIMSGESKITSNTATTNGGGMCLVGCTFKVSGNPNISENKLKDTTKDNNVYLHDYNNPKITVTGALTNTKLIGVTMMTPGVFTSSSNSSFKAKDYIEYFTSDNSSYSVKVDGDELTLVSHEHDFTYSVSDDGATITATCGADGCPLTERKATLTIAAPTELTYNGSAKESHDH